MRYVIMCTDKSGSDVWGIYDDREYAEEYMESLKKRHPHLTWEILAR